MAEAEGKWRQGRQARWERRGVEWRMYSGISGGGTWAIGLGMVQEGGEKVNEGGSRNEGEAARSA